MLTPVFSGPRGKKLWAYDSGFKTLEALLSVAQRYLAFLKGSCA